MHVNDAHQHAGHVAIYYRVDTAAIAEREPSFAERAVDAQIAQAMGISTDDDWLLGA